MNIKAMLHAVILTLYNVILIKLYLDAFLECKKWKQSVIGWGLFMVWEIGRIIQVLPIGSLGIFTHQSPGWNLLTNIIVMGAVGLLSLVLGIKYFVKKKSRDIIEHFEGKVLLLFVFAGIILYYSFYRLAYNGRVDGVENVLWLSVSALMLLVLELCIYPIYGKLAEAVWTKRNIRDYRKQIELYKCQRELERATREEVARIRHDLKQELVYLSHLLRCQEYEKMKKVLDSLYGELQENCCAEGRSGNLALDALLNHLTQETMKYKIELDLNIDVNEAMKLDDTELCALVGNIFDNAVEASKKIAENRKIWVHFSYKKGYLYFLVKNRYNGRIQRDGKIIKSTKEGMHGFGLLSVRRIVHNYHGNMEISEKDKIFSVKITAFC